MALCRTSSLEPLANNRWIAVRVCFHGAEFHLASGERKAVRHPLHEVRARSPVLQGHHLQDKQNAVSTSCRESETLRLPGCNPRGSIWLFLPAAAPHQTK